ncbi:hypothetical protein LY13_004269 [Prauserella aidingensis]|uniref:hypothetical protein n=1 Tax=Prauserella aidingensis TaxID=387890 RepID=UPI0020A385D2|nr:hypothetical protein [Prauserella aidingensis]MCP2255493.1 hypothetical protein [Prauserella aidingensis]
MTAEQPRTKRRWVWVAAASSVLVLGVAATLYFSLRETTMTVSGTIALTDGVTEYTEVGDCMGHEGYDDIGPGAQVTITGNTGTVLAAGQLGAGRQDGDAYSCLFDFDVADVPTGHGPYQVEVSHRGTIAFTEDQATGIALTLG